MSTANRSSFTELPVVLSIARASWRSMPRLVASGIASIMYLWCVAWLISPESPFFFAVGAIGIAPLILLCIDGIQGYLFDSEFVRPPLRKRVFSSICVIGGAGVLAGWSVFSVVIADTAGSAALQITAVASTFAAAMVVLVATIALPLFAIRSDASIRAMCVCAVLTLVRHPLPSLCALLFSAALVWCGLTWFVGLLVLVTPIFAILSVAAACATLPALGVDLPRITPVLTHQGTTKR